VKVSDTTAPPAHQSAPPLPTLPSDYLPQHLQQSLNISTTATKSSTPESGSPYLSSVNDLKSGEIAYPKHTLMKDFPRETMVSTNTMSSAGTPASGPATSLATFGGSTAFPTASGVSIHDPLAFPFPTCEFVLTINKFRGWLHLCLLVLLPLAPSATCDRLHYWFDRPQQSNLSLETAVQVPQSQAR
jgi:hypothetical protein